MAVSDIGALIMRGSYYLGIYVGRPLFRNPPPIYTTKMPLQPQSASCHVTLPVLFMTSKVDL